MNASGGGQTFLARFLRAKKGTTAVEFGLLALPFLGLVTACLENALVYWQQEILQQAIVDAGRQLYTGKFQTANSGTTNMATLATKFRTAICTESNGSPRLTIFDCTTVRVSVTQAETLAGATPVSPTSTDAKGVVTWNPQFQSYSCAGASAIMVIQAAVDVPAYFPLLGSSASRLSTGRRVIQAATVFKAEPYTTKSVCS
ncbi:pilus assembly protein [Methylobacterium sp. WL103]|uniref:TadE/TadG family type IV pilus assembly protein n=1 Tax=Methylobacterium sp. WL103 TaxID=2603891 RepID=UPI0011C9E0B7|nr:TadE/TadG family type IV pilus assembly protein [Methylobacterium sp. WL103]TXN06877.1 pilus assembly protein [Methylobacterium sp. WL103]